MNRTLRSKALRALLYYENDGKCAMCGCDLPDDWHADHIEPWSKTHTTNVHDMQALCPTCNLKKGATMKRKHQHDMTESIRRANASGKIRFICAHVTPGGGKSALPPIIAREIAEPKGWRMCWVVPRNALRDQGEADFGKTFMRELVGHKSSIRKASNEINPSRGLIGYVTTYQAIAAQPDLHLWEFKRNPYVLFLDECHHVPHLGAGNEDEEKAYYKAIAPLVDSARLVILATGTLERHDKCRIAFLPYKPGSEPGTEVVNIEPRPEWEFIRYSRKDALEEGAVVPLHFTIMDGAAKWFNPVTGEEEWTDSIANSSKADQSAVLKTILETGYAESLLDDCLDAWKHHKIDQYHEAKMLVIAPNIKVANQYKDYLARGSVKVAIATSDDSKEATHNIKQFKGKTIDVLVTVGMAYEGLDVPQITHVAVLTNIRSRPWLEQCFCRANRTAPGKTHGYIFIPDDTRMKEICKMIAIEQDGIAQDKEKTDRVNGESSLLDLSVVPVESMLTDQRGYGLEDGTSVDYEESAVIRRAMDAVNVKHLSVVQFKQLEAEIDRNRRQQFDIATLPPEVRFEERTPSQEEKYLRDSIKSVIGKVANGNGEQIKSINVDLVARFGARPDMTIPELRTELDYIIRKYGVRPNGYHYS